MRQNLACRTFKMTTMGVLFLCVVFAMISSINAAGGACYAPPLFYGSTCNSNTAIFGSPNHRIRYTIDQRNNAGTLICCQVKACGPAGTQTCQGFKLYTIGCSTGSLSATLPWGSNLATPAIKCTGKPFGTFLSWSH